ncbi:hypothetical protein Pint_11627 [Pistacia integerrima]|uniref:Uncharacterized protein n=1 Tax=Pistacia integerrima TaxID=434235 RepID=A0ACC0XF78_9ROSI|nr:hypothetical protein Pint_11627 [Pistacia integerrima]
MKDKVFSHEDDSMPKSLRVLLDIAIIRFDDKLDRVKTLLFSSLMSGIVDVLASNTWDKEAHKPHNNWLPSPWALVPVAVGLFGFATEEVKENM